MKSKTLRTLYFALLSEPDSAGLFRMSECNDKYYRLLETCAVHMGNTETELISEMLSDLCEFIRESAFEAGFYTNFDLLPG